MKHTWITFLGVLVVFVSTSAAAQNRFLVELRGGPAFATDALSDADLGRGWGAEATASYRFLPHLSLYGGWGWRWFPASGNAFAGADVDVEEAGYTFGLQFAHPVGSSPIGYFLRAGGIYNHLEIENSEGSRIADSGYGLGWQIGAGVIVPLGRQWYLMPGVRYRALACSISVGTTRTDVELTYVAVGVGVARAF